ncbi:hypothetical protein [Thioclava kandeliae]|uniref:Oligosaccharide repeat unit polymerase n=1 Tax=Thioclava kandeliae TaxID=3070818 RepID=A0ABV1SIY0_9RHOB
MRPKLWLLSPISLLGLAWVLTLGIGVLPFLYPDSFSLALYFLSREELGAEAITLMGLAWIAAALLFFVALNALTLLRARDLPDTRALTDFERMARRIFRANLVCLGITLVWVLSSAVQMGGIGALIESAQSDASSLRDQMLENKLFSGMRLFYGALPAIGAMACVMLAAGRKFGTMSPFARRILILVLISDLVALALLPIVMSQRILLLHLMLASYFGLCMVHQRIVALPQLILGATLFLTTWVLREAVTNPTIDNHSALEIGLQKLVFYISNDFLNSLLPFTQEFDHMLGYFSFHFLLILTQSRDAVDGLIPERLERIELVRGGGEWSMLTTPYVDFGIAGALVLLAVFAIATAIAFHRGHFGLTAATLYAHLAAGFMLSTHVQYFTNVNFVTGLALTAFLGRACHLSQQNAGRPAITPLQRAR